MALSRDAQGFTIFTPSSPSGEGDLFNGSGTRILYVDSSSGSDSNHGTLAAPYATLHKGISNWRAGFPDWVLMKMGTSYPNQCVKPSLTVSLDRYGRSADEPAVVGSYHASATLTPNPGNSFGAFPIVMPPPTQNAMMINSPGGNHTWFTGFDVYRPDNDPNNANCAYTAQTVTFSAPGSPVTVTFPAGTVQTSYLTDQQVVWFFGVDLPLPLSVPSNDGAMNPRYYAVNISGNTCQLQPVRVFTVFNFSWTRSGSNVLAIGIDTSATRQEIVAGEVISNQSAGIPVGTTITGFSPFGPQHVNPVTLTNGSDIVTTSVIDCNNLWIGQSVRLDISGGLAGHWPSDASADPTFVSQILSATQFRVIKFDGTPRLPTNGGASGPMWADSAVTMSNAATATSQHSSLVFSPSTGSRIVLTDAGSGSFTARLRGPNNQPGISDGLIALAMGASGLTDYNIEDVRVRFCNTGINTESTNGSNIIIRRNRLIDSLAVGLHNWQNPVGYSVEENLIDIGGWIKDYQIGEHGRSRTGLWHDMYLSADPNSPPHQHLDKFRGNIIGRDNNVSQTRNGGQIIANLWLESPQGSHQIAAIDSWAPGYQIAYNVYMDTGGGVGECVVDVAFSQQNTLIEENIAVHTYQTFYGAFVQTTTGMGSTGVQTLLNNIGWGHTNATNANNQAISIDLSNKNSPSKSESDRTLFNFPPACNKSMRDYLIEIMGVSSSEPLIATAQGADWYFLDLCRLQRKGSWDQRLTALAVVNWTRTNFGRTTYSWGQAPAPQYHRVTLTMTAA